MKNIAKLIAMVVGAVLIIIGFFIPILFKRPRDD
jgi:hypothetical protein